MAGNPEFDREMAKLRFLLRRGDIKQESFDLSERVLRGKHGLTVASDEQRVRVIDTSNPESIPAAPGKSGAETLVGGILLLVLLVLFGFLFKTCMGPTKNDAEIAERHRNGFHCLSAWDGSESDLVAKVKEMLRDPSSFEHVKTQITQVNSSGEHTVIMEYRARNGFGGLNVEFATGTIKNSDCSLVDWTAQ
ncbi:hypothetical protein [Mesorhizobium sp. M0802]|uniref:hypothetical protein n=1 Tax=Mesorhizobium sp. M0802 TaxID=2957001 RepID=UPI0033350D40